ncbi:YceI family protein, partial [Amycolatopsis sacchari]|uniref:YceI family protein n=1 Tax=Amycolatopsis sacchari TaxID=115433 RepID=UPI003EB79FCA
TVPARPAEENSVSGDPHPTVELPAATTAFAPVEDLPLPGRYELDPDRFVLETTARLLRCPVLRGRFAATAGHLVLDPDQPELALELDTRSLRTRVPGLARLLTDEGGLCASTFPAIRFTSTRMGVTSTRFLDLAGRLEVLGVTRELRLTGRLAYVDENSVVLWVKGVLPPPRRPLKRGSPPARVIARRPLHLELAAEFAR